MTDLYCVGSTFSFLIAFALVLAAQGYRKGVSPTLAIIGMIVLIVLGIVLIILYFKSLFLPL